MKKLLPFVVLLILVSCQDIEKSMAGLYHTETIDGPLYLSLADGGDCISYLQGGKESYGFWHINGDSGITISVKVDIESDGWPLTYRIGYPIGDGDVYENHNFSIPAKRSYRGDTKEITLTFRKSK